MSEQQKELAAAAARLCLTVAIDGPAGAGKSTIGGGLAAALGCCSLDTGLMYRAVTFLAMASGTSLDDGPGLGALAAGILFQVSPDDGGRLLVNGVPSGPALRTPDVDARVSAVSAHSEVRSLLVQSQRSLARGRCFVMIGRDIGTTVLPTAGVKIWVTASPEERARRRLSEHLAGAGGISLDTMAEQIRLRDEVDSTREVSPLRRAEDAVVLHTDGQTPHETLCTALVIVHSAVHRIEEVGAGHGATNH